MNEIKKEDIIFYDTDATEKQDIKEIGFEKMYEWNEDKKEIIYKIKTDKYIYYE